MKYKVLIIVNRTSIGGLVFHTGYLTKYLKDDIFDTMLIAGNVEPSELGNGEILEEMGVKPIIISNMYRSLNPLKDYRAYKEIKEIIKEYKPHIIHTHGAKSGALGRLAAISNGVSIIIHTFHGHIFHSYFGKIKTKIYVEIERYLAARSSKIIVLSKLQKKEIVETYKIAPEEKFIVVPLGFDLNRFQRKRNYKREQFRKEFNLKEDEIAIGIVGRLVPIKNHSLFIQSLDYVLKNTSKKVRAFIIGDGEERVALMNLAQKLDISFNVQCDEVFDKPLCFTSWRVDIDVINAGLDVMTLTSLNEGTPVCLIEAQAAGLPIVATNVGGVNDIVLENKTAILVKNNKAEIFGSELLQLIENENLRKEFSQNGFNYVTQNFNCQKLLRNIRELYLELLKDKFGLRNN